MNTRPPYFPRLDPFREPQQKLGIWELRKKQEDLRREIRSNEQWCEATDYRSFDELNQSLQHHLRLTEREIDAWYRERDLPRPPSPQPGDRQKWK